MRRGIAFLAAAYVILSVASAARTEPGTGSELHDERSAGDATVPVQSRSAFTQHVPGLSAEQLSRFALGDHVFRTPWVEAPASVQAFDGLGPFYSARSCSGCHMRDGRGHPPDGPDDVSRSMVVKLGVPDSSGRRRPDARYGSHLSERAVRGLTPEGRLVVRWEDVEHVYADGEKATLRRPRIEIAAPDYGALSHDVRISARIAPAVIGGGLLESVPDSALMALADSGDADGDGVSGRVHWLEATKPGAAPARRRGRFGWKASQPSLAAQVATALADDIGITTPARRELDLTRVQRAARSKPRGGEPELEGATLAALIEYCRLVAVPARRNVDDAVVRRGAERFRDAGCTGCHVATLPTGDDSVRAMARQLIHPYSDLLLHDMGPGLSDGMPEGNAQASEWRTAPLWGLGRSVVVSGYLYLLHDGRARTFEEAILWHDGEARRSRDAFEKLPADSRSDLLRFLESL